MKFYEVCAKVGHVGRNNYIEKVFAVRAYSGKEAAAVARQIPRVKHDHKDAIRYVSEIDENEYLAIRDRNNIDPYFKCTNIQEQRRQCELNVFREEKSCSTVEGKREKNSRKRELQNRRARKEKKHSIGSLLYTEMQFIS